MHISLLSVNNIMVQFSGGSGGPSGKNTVFKAVSGVSFSIRHGEVLGLVGESGCGKTTVSRAIVRLISVQSGSVVFEGTDITNLSHKQLAAIRPRMQMVFQDPYSSLNPRMTIFDALSEPLRFHNKLRTRQCDEAVAELMNMVGLDTSSIRKYPHEFSGGQRQRIAIARALCLKPSLLIADEPVSALDVSIQAQIVNLLAELRRSMNLAMLFISHDLSVVRHISDRIAVMYKGKIVETASSDSLFTTPLHPYTQALIAAIPVPDPDHIITPAEPPKVPGASCGSGCPYVDRCPKAVEACAAVAPVLEPHKNFQNHAVSCFLA